MSCNSTLTSSTENTSKIETTTTQESTPRTEAEPHSNHAQDVGIASIQEIPTSVFGAQIVRYDEPTFAAATRAKLSWTRFALDWDAIESTEGVYAWSPTIDAYISRLSNSHRVILYIFGTPPWAADPSRAGKRCSPISTSKVDAFRNFVRAAAERYGAQVHHWEFWNEPDAAFVAVPATYPYGCWGDPSDNNGYGGGYYAKFLQVFRDTIRQVDAAHQNAWGLKVSSGGILLGCDQNATGQCGNNGGNPNFIKGILQTEKELNTGPLFDILSYHAYAIDTGSALDPDLYGWNGTGLSSNSYGWSSTDRGLLRGKADYLRNVMNSFGVTRPLFMNEGGHIVWDADNECDNLITNDNGVEKIVRPLTGTERHQILQRSSYHIWRLYIRAVSDGLLGASWYTLNPWHWKCSGLSSPSPADNKKYLLEALAFLANKLTGATYVGQIAAPKPSSNAEAILEGHRFCAGNEEMIVYWTVNDSKPVTIQIPADTPPSSATVYNSQGDAIATKSGSEFVNVGFEPVMVSRSISGGCKAHQIFLPIISR